MSWSPHIDFSETSSKGPADQSKSADREFLQGKSLGALLHSPGCLQCKSFIENC
ncbi:hypothetical protein M758_1G313000 [Ceratodon purpureus]|nr:hypothetical protein M758_1G313000 [Ceratodon purpureus]